MVARETLLYLSRRTRCRRRGLGLGSRPLRDGLRSSIARSSRNPVVRSPPPVRSRDCMDGGATDRFNGITGLRACSKSRPAWKTRSLTGCRQPWAQAERAGLSSRLGSWNCARPRLRWFATFAQRPRATRSVPFACSTLIGLVRTRFAPMRNAFATPACPSTTATANADWFKSECPRS